MQNLLNKILNFIFGHYDINIKPPMQPQISKNEQVPVPPVHNVPKVDKIALWAKGIEQWEGGPASANHNPGNMKFSTLTKSWGAVQGNKAADGGYFAKFQTYQKGFTALCNFLTLGCENQLSAFHQARTFQKFTTIYAGNPPLTYIQGIAKIVGCELDTDISTFLT